MTVFISAFEATAVITALPTIADKLDGRSLYGTVFATSLLASLLAVVVAGELADRHGPALPFVAAATLFVIGLVVAGTSTTMVQVVGGRFLQGLGIGGFSSLAYVAVSTGFEPEQRPTMYAVLSAGWVVPGLIAPLLAGWITQHLGWKWVFLTMTPVPVLASLVVVPKLRALPLHRQIGTAKFVDGGDGADRGDDLGGFDGVDRDDDGGDRGDRGGGGVLLPSRLPLAVQLTLGAAGVLAGVQIRPVPAGVAVAVVGIGVAIRPLRSLLPAGTFTARRGLAAVVTCRMLATMAFLGVDSFVPLAADRIHHVSPTKQGFVIIGAVVTWTTAQALSARLDSRVAPQRLTRIGFLFLAAGAVLVIPVVRHGWPLWVTFLSWAVGGFGMGMLFNPTTVVAMGSAASGQEGLVSSQVNIADSLGFATISTFGGAIVAITEHTSLRLAPALVALFSVAAVLAGVGAVLAGRIVRPAELLD
jgi:MFS family permease